MLSRSSILVLCCVISLLAHALLFYFAPRVTLFDKPAVPRPILKKYKIQLESRARTEAVARLERGAAELASRPGSISDLLERNDETATPTEDRAKTMAEVPELPERVAEETLDRNFDLEQDPAQLDRIDARILEIAERTAREDIQVARRLVRPSPDRILASDAEPVLRAEARPGSGIPLSIVARPFPKGATEDAGDAKPEPEAIERPPFESVFIEPEVLDAEEMAMPVEEMIARGPIDRELTVVKETSGFEVIDDLVAFKLDAYAPPGESMGYFRLQILPRSSNAIASLPKDVTFVIDASKSISQPKLNATSDGVQAAIGQLQPQDHFNVVIFRDAPELFQSDPVPATPANKEAARNFISRLNSQGETDVYKAIHPVIAQPPRPGVPGLVMVVSDGRPTTGMRDGRTIINGLTSDNSQRNSIIAFAGGRTVNRYLLDLLAYRNKGESYVVDAIEEIPQALPSFFKRYEAPLLLQLEADYGRVDESNVYPQVVPDFYRDRPVTIYGRYDRNRDKNFVMRLTGNASGKSKEIVFRADFESATTGDRAIARNWAFEKSYDIIGQMVTRGELPELLEQLRSLELRYNIRTSYSE